MANQYQVSRKTYEEIVYRFIFGKSFTQIAKELRLNKKTVRDTIRKYWYTGYPEEIKNEEKV
jgi:DNA-binding CsgD family transcriptional regulator